MLGNVEEPTDWKDWANAVIALSPTELHNALGDESAAGKALKLMADHLVEQLPKLGDKDEDKNAYLIQIRDEDVYMIILVSGEGENWTTTGFVHSYHESQPGTWQIQGSGKIGQELPKISADAWRIMDEMN